jgi:hypothetical protein
MRGFVWRFFVIKNEKFPHKITIGLVRALINPPIKEGLSFRKALLFFVRV